MANLQFDGREVSVHNPNNTKANQYRDMMEMFAQSIYASELYLPVYGYGAMTFPGSTETSHLFPMSMDISSPMIPNQRDFLVESYNNCLKKIKLHCPVKLTPLVQFFKQLALTAREKQERAF